MNSITKSLFSVLAILAVFQTIGHAFASDCDLIIKKRAEVTEESARLAAASALLADLKDKITEQEKDLRVSKLAGRTLITLGIAVPVVVSGANAFDYIEAILGMRLSGESVDAQLTVGKETQLLVAVLGAGAIVGGVLWIRAEKQELAQLKADVDTQLVLIADISKELNKDTEALNSLVTTLNCTK